MVSMNAPVVVVLAVAVATLLACVEGVGAVAEEPDGKFHCAKVSPQMPEPELAVVSVKLAVANLPVSSEFTKR